MKNSTKFFCFWTILLVIGCFLSTTVWADSEKIEFNGHYYQRIGPADPDSGLNWSQAKAACEELGGYLATITSQEENDFVLNEIIYTGSAHHWLGATDELQEGTWQWITGEPWDYTNWDTYEPNNGGPDGENYLEARYSGKWNDNMNGVFTSQCYICEWIAFVDVTIDIKPGSDPNSINLSSAGVVPVAILSSNTFDATTVNAETVSLAGAAVQLVGKSGKYLWHEEDVNGDGLMDIVCQVATAEFMIELGESVAMLEGETYEGTPIRGEDSIQIVPDN